MVKFKPNKLYATDEQLTANQLMARRMMQDADKLYFRICELLRCSPDSYTDEELIERFTDMLKRIRRWEKEAKEIDSLVKERSYISSAKI